MVNLTMEEVWRVKSYFVINTKLKLAGLVLLAMTYLDSIVSVRVNF